MLEQSYTKEVSATIQILIEDYERLFGRETPPLFLAEAAMEQGKEASTARGQAQHYIEDILYPNLHWALSTEHSEQWAVRWAEFRIVTRVRGVICAKQII